MKKNIIIFLLCLYFMLFGCFFVFAAAPNSCVTCHTNESLMKSMHKPPPMPASVGEG